MLFAHVFQNVPTGDKRVVEIVVLTFSAAPGRGDVVLFSTAAVSEQFSETEAVAHKTLPTLEHDLPIA